MPDNIKDNKRVVVTHGELVLVPIDKLNDGKKITTKTYIAGHSETGHHHIIDSEVEFDVIEGANRQILLREVGKLWHKKSFDAHETRTLAPGAYEIVHKKEYNPFTKVMDRIWD